MLNTILNQFISNTASHNCIAEEYGYNLKKFKKSLTIKKILDWIENNIFIELSCFKDFEQTEIENIIGGLTVYSYNDTLKTPKLTKDKKSIGVDISTIIYTLNSETPNITEVSCGFPVTSLSLHGKTYVVNIKSNDDWKELCKYFSKKHLDGRFAYYFDENNCEILDWYGTRTVTNYKRVYNIENILSQTPCCFKEEDLKKMQEEINKL